MRSSHGIASASSVDKSERADLAARLSEAKHHSEQVAAIAFQLCDENHVGGCKCRKPSWKDSLHDFIDVAPVQDLLNIADAIFATVLLSDSPYLCEVTISLSVPRVWENTPILPEFVMMHLVDSAFSQQWLRVPEASRPPHPMLLLIGAWYGRPTPLAQATVTATKNGTGMTRRPRHVSNVLRTDWEEIDAGVHGVIVDGEPIAALREDPAALFPMAKRRPRRRFKPGEQCLLPLPVVKTVPSDLRLVALRDVSADPNSSTVLCNDVLILMNYAHVTDRPLTLTERVGAALLVRNLKGDPRPVQPQHDFRRFWKATYELRTLCLFDLTGTDRWLPLAHVDVPCAHPVDRVTIGPPKWMRPHRGKWTLTAEGSAAAASRVVAGKYGLSGRLICGIEYRLASSFGGKPNSIPTDLLPAEGRGRAGRIVELPWRIVMHLGGDYWHKDDLKADRAALERFNRHVDRLDALGYFVPNAMLSGTAPAGDSVEILERVRGHRGRPASLLVRSSARFVEAARLAQLPDGAGFEYRRLPDWAGLR